MEAYFERFTLEITPEHAEIGSHPGACDEDIAYLLTLDEIQSQFDAISPELIAAELKEYGAWDEIELSDTESNKGRILWIACGNINEELS